MSRRLANPLICGRTSKLLTLSTLSIATLRNKPFLTQLYFYCFSHYYSKKVPRLTASEGRNHGKIKFNTLQHMAKSQPLTNSKGSSKPLMQTRPNENTF